MRVMGTYGVKGIVTVPNGTKSRRTLAEISYCGLVQNGVTGLQNSQNKLDVIEAAVPCPASRRFLGDSTGAADHRNTEHAKVANDMKVRILTHLFSQGGDAVQRQTGSTLLTARKRAVTLWPSLASRLPSEKKVRMLDAARQREQERLREKPINDYDDLVHGRYDEHQGVSRGSSVVSRKLLQSNVSLGRACTDHSQCDQTAVDEYLPKGSGANKGAFCIASGTCDTCSACQYDAIDSYNQQCPQTECPGSGLFPECIDAKKLTEDWVCPDKHIFEIWKHFDKGDTITVAPSASTKMKYVTPFNRLVGPIMVSQQRRTLEDCTAIVNPSVLKFSEETGCQRPLTRDPTPFGMDPFFISAASIYDGKVDPERYYRGSERINKTTVVRDIDGNEVNLTEASTPIGFFSHQYDGVTGQRKPAAGISKTDMDSFIAYFDGRISADQAQKMLTYMQEGGFIDAQTKQVRCACFVCFDHVKQGIFKKVLHTELQ